MSTGKIMDLILLTRDLKCSFFVLFCLYSVKNIDCACQDAEDLSHFAYITKDFDNNIHYCHVFNVDSMVSWNFFVLFLGSGV